MYIWKSLILASWFAGRAPLCWHRKKTVREKVCQCTLNAVGWCLWPNFLLRLCPANAQHCTVSVGDFSWNFHSVKFFVKSQRLNFCKSRFTQVTHVFLTNVLVDVYVPIFFLTTFCQYTALHSKCWWFLWSFFCQIT